MTTPRCTFILLILVLGFGACTTQGPSSGASGAEISIGCRGPYRDVMQRLLKLHDDLNVAREQEFYWASYENAYERYADARSLARDLRDSGVQARSRTMDDNNALRLELQQARDAFYRSLTPEQKTIADAWACRLAHP
ncbi:MAG: Spy/CpxP family protein refolding chaperone [Alphaproteobacteria bacterium]